MDHYDSGRPSSPAPQGLFAGRHLQARQKRRRRLSVFGVAMLGILALFVIVLCLIILITGAEAPYDSQRLVPEADKARINSLLEKHGLRGAIAVVEIRPADGTLWFERDGRAVQLQ